MAKKLGQIKDTLIIGYAYSHLGVAGIDDVFVVALAIQPALEDVPGHMGIVDMVGRHGQIFSDDLVLVIRWGLTVLEDGKEVLTVRAGMGEGGNCLLGSYVTCQF